MVPGSHKLSDMPLNQTSARILTVPGDLILFDQRLWHQGSQQIDTAGGDRVLVTLGFAGNNSTLTNEFERGTAWRFRHVQVPGHRADAIKLNMNFRLE